MDFDTLSEIAKEYWRSRTFYSNTITHCEVADFLNRDLFQCGVLPKDHLTKFVLKVDNFSAQPLSIAVGHREAVGQAIRKMEKLKETATITVSFSFSKDLRYFGPSLSRWDLASAEMGPGNAEFRTAHFKSFMDPIFQCLDRLHDTGRNIVFTLEEFRVRRQAFSFSVHAWKNLVDLYLSVSITPTTASSKIP